MFQALLVDALFFSPSGNFKNQASIVVYVHLHKIDMLGLPRNPWASPGAQSGPTESDEGTPCLQMFVFVLEGLRF